MSDVTRFRAWSAGLVLATSGLALAAMPASAERFSCPTTGGHFIFAQEAQVAGLDMHFSSAISARNIAMNMYESLMTRNESNAPVHELAESHTVSDDGLTLTFKLREGVKFHNGKTMTSADVLASFERYQRIGIDRGVLGPVESLSAPDPHTFVITLKEQAPVFIEELSSFRVPIVIIPAEEAGKDGNRIEFIGTGPFRFVEWVADSHVELARFEDYVPNEAFDGKDGFAGYKQACFDRVTIRIITESGARVAALETGEVQGVEDIPTPAAQRLQGRDDIQLIPLENWWVHTAFVNWHRPPTDNLAMRKAIQVGLDMEEIMEIATDGAYTLNHGYQYPGNPYYSESGSEWYNVADPERAKQYLAEAGYNGEEVVLMTNSDYTNMYNAALVMSEQLKAIGINAVLDVSDWPTSRDRRTNPDAWNLFFTGLGTGPSVGPRGAVVDLLPPTNISNATEVPELMEAWRRLNTDPTDEGRRAAFGDVQQALYDNVHAIVMGALSKVQAVRSNVHGFVPFRIPRMWNVWFEG
jgi:peptide/nickel transport system substrate-binding protein